MKLLYKISGLLILAVSVLACKQEKSEKEGIYIVCTTGMLADALENILGDQAVIEALMGPGVDPHLYKASQGDLSKLRKADIIIYNGLHLEGKMGEVLERLKSQKTVIAAAELLPETSIRLTEDGVSDPHIWFDVRLWAEMIELLSLELSQTSLFDTKKLEAASQNYLQELLDLHDWVKNEISQIPIDQRVLVTAHDAFQYFGLAYQMEVRGLQGLSTLSEFGLRDISELVKFLTERKIPAVFVESSVSDKALKAVVEGAEKQNHKVIIGGNLFSDAMGEKGSKEGHYIGMVEHNVNAIVKALGGGN